MSIPDHQSRMLPVLELAAKAQTSLPLSLYVKRLDHSRFIWPTPADDAVAVSAAQLGYLLEGICLTNNAAEGELRDVALGGGLPSNWSLSNFWWRWAMGTRKPRL